MSKVSYKKNPYTIYLVEVSFSNKKYIRPSYMNTEKDALEDTLKNSVQSFREDFKMKIVGKKEY